MQLNIPLSNILPNQTTGGASGAPLDAEVEATLVRSQNPSCAGCMHATGAARVSNNSMHC